MGYSKPEDVLDMIKTDMLRSLFDDDCRMEESDLRPAALPLAETAVSDADAEIDGYLAKRYQVPLAKVPQMVRKLSKDIAAYNLVSRRGMDESTRDKGYLNRYESAIKYLTVVAKGIVDIYGASSGDGTGITEGAEHGNTGFKVRSNGRLFSRESMRGL